MQGTRIVNQQGGQYAEGNIINITQESRLSQDVKNEYVHELMKFTESKNKRTILYLYATAKNYGFSFKKMADDDLIDVYKHMNLIKLAIKEGLNEMTEPIQKQSKLEMIKSLIFGIIRK